MSDCLICGEGGLSEFSEYADLGRVTSDCKPWPAGGRLFSCDHCGAIQKTADEKWLGEIERIYRSYEIYYQAGGAEQPIYDSASGAGEPRSVKLVRHLVAELGLGDSGKLLDFGCGTGGALANFSAALPRWSLYGSELSSSALPLLREIPGFVELFTCPPSEIAQRFDLVTLIHSLEHLLDPVAMLRELAARVEENGRLFVEVPDCGSNPYDLVVADHLSHFTLETLRLAADRAGCKTVSITNSLLPKELSWLGTRGAAPKRVEMPNAADGSALGRRHVAWLRAQVAEARRISKKSVNFGIFGTSISGTWLSGNLPGGVSFFVDEDPLRIGRTHMGHPILSPSQIPAGSDVFVPLIPVVAAGVAKRLGGHGATLHVPPPIS